MRLICSVVITSFFFLVCAVEIYCMKKKIENVNELGVEVKFDKNYVVTYGFDHFLQFNGGTEVQISLDQFSGAGFKSKVGYGSGYFQMKIKLPSKHSPGVVTTFYLNSNPDNTSGNHDELDFEFLGTDGPNYTLQTNVFANDNGGREQRLHLWFDPTLMFHNYAILWNPRQIVFFIDEVPIRVFKNYSAMGARYPSKSMVLEGSIWNGEQWASGGRKVDWSQAPFQAQYKGFNILGCQFGNRCESETFPWNRRVNWELNPNQRSAYENVKRKYVFEDYCSDPRRRQQYKECQFEKMKEESTFEEEEYIFKNGRGN